MSSILERVDLLGAQQFFTAACGYSRAHSALAQWAMSYYGCHGPQISGVVRGHFPEATKNHLRALARACTAASDSAYALRPPRVRMATMRKLAQAVAKRDGSGFYGPQP